MKSITACISVNTDAFEVMKLDFVYYELEMPNTNDPRLVQPKCTEFKLMEAVRYRRYQEVSRPAKVSRVSMMTLEIPRDVGRTRVFQEF